MQDWDEIRENLSSIMRDRRLSSARLGELAGVNRKTIENFLKGRSEYFYPHTLTLLEKFLEIRLDGEGLPANLQAKGVVFDTGGYSQDLMEQFCGKYFSFRKSYDYSDGIICSLVTLEWDAESNLLKSHEVQKNLDRKSGKSHNYLISGSVFSPDGMPIMQLISNFDGFLRNTTLSTMSFGRDKILRGVVVTLNEIRAVGFKPASSPVLMIKDDAGIEEKMLTKIGSMKVTECWHPDIAAEFEEISSDFSRIGTT